MSATARTLTAERMAAACTRPSADWTDELNVDGLTFAVALLQQAATPEAQAETRAALADRGLSGAELDGALRIEHRVYVATLTRAIEDLSRDFGRRHPEMRLSEETWRSAMASALAAMIRRRRG